MKLTMDFYDRDTIEAWFYEHTHGIKLETADGMTANAYPSRGQAAQIIRTLAPYAGIELAESGTSGELAEHAPPSPPPGPAADAEVKHQSERNI